LTTVKRVPDDPHKEFDTKTILMIEFGGESANLVESEVAARFVLRARIVDAPRPRTRMRGPQLHGEDVLEEVSRLRLRYGADYAIGFVEDDIYVPEMNFVFGLASHDLRSAVVSSTRLGSPKPGVFKDRLTKETVHELGHVFGLGHCDDALCIMHFSNSLADTDLKTADLCDKCKASLRLP
jgi:predicted Zn-dependent protease